jgi:hypothetical protein
VPAHLKFDANVSKFTVAGSANLAAYAAHGYGSGNLARRNPSAKAAIFFGST